jgi:hypothetical protein
MPAGNRQQSERYLAFREATPGRYRATFSIVDAEPAGCSRSGKTTICPTPPPSRTPDGRFELCRGDRTISKEFVLPARGRTDVVVRVSGDQR